MESALFQVCLLDASQLCSNAALAAGRFDGLGINKSRTNRIASSIAGGILSSTLDGSLQWFLRDSRVGNGTAPVRIRYIMQPSAHKSIALVYSDVSESISWTK
jgi:hypothetical protein